MTTDVDRRNHHEIESALEELLQAPAPDPHYAAALERRLVSSAAGATRVPAPAIAATGAGARRWPGRVLGRVVNVPPNGPLPARRAGLVVPVALAATVVLALFGLSNGFLHIPGNDVRSDAGAVPGSVRTAATAPGTPAAVSVLGDVRPTLDLPEGELPYVVPGRGIMMLSPDDLVSAAGPHAAAGDGISVTVRSVYVRSTGCDYGDPNFQDPERCPAIRGTYVDMSSRLIDPWASVRGTDGELPAFGHHYWLVSAALRHEDGSEDEFTSWWCVQPERQCTGSSGLYHVPLQVSPEGNGEATIVVRATLSRYPVAVGADGYPAPMRTPVAPEEIGVRELTVAIPLLSPRRGDLAPATPVDASAPIHDTIWRVPSVAFTPDWTAVVFETVMSAGPDLVTLKPNESYGEEDDTTAVAALVALRDADGNPIELIRCEPDCNLWLMYARGNAVGATEPAVATTLFFEPVDPADGPFTLTGRGYDLWRDYRRTDESGQPVTQSEFVPQEWSIEIPSAPITFTPEPGP
jgi:hypothetical protein